MEYYTQFLQQSLSLRINMVRRLNLPLVSCKCKCQPSNSVLVLSDRYLEEFCQWLHTIYMYICMYRGTAWTPFTSRGRRKTKTTTASTKRKENEKKKKRKINLLIPSPAWVSGHEARRIACSHTAGSVLCACLVAVCDCLSCQRSP